MCSFHGQLHHSQVYITCADAPKAVQHKIQLNSQIQAWVFAGHGIRKTSFSPSKLWKIHTKLLKPNTFWTYRDICTVMLLQAWPLMKYMLQGIPTSFQAWHFLKGHLYLAKGCCLSLEWSLRHRSLHFSEWKKGSSFNFHVSRHWNVWFDLCPFTMVLFGFKKLPLSQLQCHVIKFENNIN